MSESEKPFKQEIDYHRYWKDRAERAEKTISILDNKIIELEHDLIDKIFEVEEVKKQADDLMVEKMKKYEMMLQKARESGL